MKTRTKSVKVTTAAGNDVHVQIRDLANGKRVSFVHGGVFRSLEVSDKWTTAQIKSVIYGVL